MKLLFSLLILISIQSFGQQTTTVKVPPSKDTTVVRFTTTTTTTSNTQTTYTTNNVPTKTDSTIIDPPPPPPSTPGKIEGFGADVTGGSGFQIVFCNSLTESALRNAIGSGNRIVKFSVSGTINAKLNFTNLKNVTIDGEGKITINNNSSGGDMLAFEGSSSNIIVQNMRFRNTGNDCIGIRCKNVVIDHCSFDNSADGLVDLTDGAENVTIQYCIFGKSGSGAGAMLLAYAGTRNISVHHNVFSSWERLPLVHRASNGSPTSTEDLMCVFENNIVWGWSRLASWVDYGGTGQFKNNLYQKASGAIVINQDSRDAKIFSSGNIVKGGGGVGVTNHAEWNIPAAYRVSLLPAAEAAAKTKAEAGPRPLDTRDSQILNGITL